MKTLLTISLISISIAGTCQFQVSLSAGYGSFQMTELKRFQEEQLAFPVDAEITASFPSYWIYSLSGQKFMNNLFLIGMSGSFGSTGGRAYYEDYSGKIGADQLLTFKSLSVCFGAWSELQDGKLRLSFDISPGVTFTAMKVESYFQATGASATNEKTSLRSTNVHVQPTVGLARRFGALGMNVFAGYHLVVVSGKIKLKDNNDAYLINNGSPVKADWSGFRVGAGLIWYLKNEED